MSIFEDDYQSLQPLIKMCSDAEKINIRLRIVHNICQVLLGNKMDKQFEKEVQMMAEFSREKLLNHEFMKAVHKRNALILGEPITYFGDDVPKGDMYDYDEELEKDINELDFMITAFIGKTMKHIQSSEMI